MAPERPRSVSYDIPLPPRIIDRKPEPEVREVPTLKPKRRSKKLTLGIKLPELLRPGRVERVQPRIIPRYVEPDIIDPEYVDLREPRRPRPPPINVQRPHPDDFVPLPPAVPSPRRPAGEEIPILETRSPRSARRLPIIHAPTSPLREHRRRRTPSSSPSPVREVETIRIRRLDKTDRGKAERVRARDVEDQTRIERERRYGAEEVNYRLADIVLRETSERRRAEAQRQSAEIAVADLQRENEELARARRIADREAVLAEREREQERERARERVRDAIRRPHEARDPSQARREVPRPARDRGAEVIRAAQEARRQDFGERISYYHNGRRIDQDRCD